MDALGAVAVHDVQMQVPLRVFSRDGKLLGVFGEKRRIPVAVDEMPDCLKQAFIAGEDARFYEHFGLDYQGISRAVWSLATTGEKTIGGSTITQQTAKNLFKRKSRSYDAKLNEMLYALRLEYRFSKEQILEFYCNQFYVSGNGHGLGVAARYYFDKEPGELTLLEAAFIDGSVKQPNYYNPFIKKDKESILKARLRAEKRAEYVLGNKLKLGMISQGEYDIAANEEIMFNRGKTNADLFPELETIIGDRDPDIGAGLGGLADRKWDAVIDTSGYWPRIVNASASLLADRVKQYLFISTVSVYASNSEVGADTSAELAMMDDPTVEDFGEQFEVCASDGPLCSPRLVVDPEGGLEEPLVLRRIRRDQAGGELGALGIEQVDRLVDRVDDLERDLGAVFPLPFDPEIHVGYQFRAWLAHPAAGPSDLGFCEPLCRYEPPGPACHVKLGDCPPRPTRSVERTPEDDVGGQQQLERFRRALGRLPEAQKRVLELSYFQGLTQRQIAAEIGIPPPIDFAQVESDDQQVNLTRFSLFLISFGTPTRIA